MNSYYNILLKAEDTGNLSLKEISFLLDPPSPEKERELFKTADRVREYYMGSHIWFRGIIEFSNKCSRNCLYCGLRSQNKDKWRYEMSVEEILETAKKIAALGIGTVVLQSGEHSLKRENFCKTIEKIKDLGLAVTLSTGENSREVYKEFRKFGVDRFLLRHETIDNNLYERLHPGFKLEKRVRCLEVLKEEGFEVGCGFMVGIPGQTFDILAKDILFCKEIEADMIGIGPFIPHPKTPLKEEKEGDFQITLRVLAITRLVCRDVHLPATTALATVDPFGREKAWQAGANVIMPNATPEKYKNAYELYPGKKSNSETLEIAKDKLVEKIHSINRIVGSGVGGSYKKIKPEW